MKCDEALALLRANTPESLRLAQEMLGVTITRCPPALMAWPPKPVATSGGRDVRIRKLASNPFREGSTSEAKFRRMKLGMTRVEILSRGISSRDIRQWSERGLLEIR